MGTRDIAMSKPPIEEKPLYPRPFTPGYGGRTLYDDEYPSYLGKNYQTPTYPTAYEEPIPGLIKITINVTNAEIGDIADWRSNAYNAALAEGKATEIAYDKLDGIFNKDYASKYSMSFETEEGTDDVDVTIILTPVI